MSFSDATKPMRAQSAARHHEIPSSRKTHPRSKRAKITNDLELQSFGTKTHFVLYGLITGPSPREKCDIRCCFNYRNKIKRSPCHAHQAPACRQEMPCKSRVKRALMLFLRQKKRTTDETGTCFSFELLTCLVKKLFEWQSAIHRRIVSRKLLRPARPRNYRVTRGSNGHPEHRST